MPSFMRPLGRLYVLFYLFTLLFALLPCVLAAAAPRASLEQSSGDYWQLDQIVPEDKGTYCPFKGTIQCDHISTQKGDTSKFYYCNQFNQWEHLSCPRFRGCTRDANSRGEHCRLSFTFSVIVNPKKPTNGLNQPMDPLSMANSIVHQEVQKDEETDDENELSVPGLIAGNLLQNDPTKGIFLNLPGTPISV
ncbi:MAG: hypothetical protein DHS80DRAFT_29423 [Piptocephalis tieghemiana]|nr:MAG: hypothetical protein DHS80DRAFT_29423 [Piptocephalis tieghemiana]